MLRKEKETKKKTQQMFNMNRKDLERTVMLVYNTKQYLPVYDTRIESVEIVTEVIGLRPQVTAEMTWIGGDLYALIVESKAQKGQFVVFPYICYFCLWQCINVYIIFSEELCHSVTVEMYPAIVLSVQGTMKVFEYPLIFTKLLLVTREIRLKQ